MATYSIPGQNLSIPIPSEGEVFKWGDMVMKRTGKEIVQLGNQYTSPEIKKIYDSAPLYAEADKLWDQAGFNLNKSPLGVGSISMFQQTSPASNETITQAVNPENPHGSIITSSILGELSKSPSLAEQAAKFGISPELLKSLQTTKTPGGYAPGLPKQDVTATPYQKELADIAGGVKNVQTSLAAISKPGADKPGGTDYSALIKAINEINTKANAEQDADASTLSDSGFTVDVRKSSELAGKLVDLLDDDEKPKTPDLLSELNTKRAELGVGLLEDNLAKLDTDIAKLDADYASTLEEEELRPVSMAQIKRRQGADDVAYNRARRDIVAERNGVANQLNMKYGVINTMMTLTGKQYDMAQDEYQFKYNKALNLINLFRDIEQDKLTREDRALDNARANLKVVSDLLEGGSVTFDSLSDSAKLDIKNMEIQAGLPVGFTKFIKSTTKGEVSFLTAFTDENGKRIQPVAVKGANGSYEIKNVELGTAKEEGDKILSPDKIAKLSVAGIPEVVSKDIQSSLNAGYDLETIRRHLAKNFGQDTGYRYLDIFMAVFQGED